MEVLIKRLFSLSRNWVLMSMKRWKMQKRRKTMTRQIWRNLMRKMRGGGPGGSSMSPFADAATLAFFSKTLLMGALE